MLDKKAGKAGGFLHWGGTTRNIIDTGNKLVIREIHRQILKELHLSIKILSNLCKKFVNTHACQNHDEKCFANIFWF